MHLKLVCHPPLNEKEEEEEEDLRRSPALSESCTVSVAVNFLRLFHREAQLRCDVQVQDSME